MPRSTSGLGWVRDLPDPRDLRFSVSAVTLATLPKQVDLRPRCPPVYDQGRIGSCTANAIAGAIQFDRMKWGEKPDFVPSRLFIYYNERAIEGHTAFDSGAQIRDGIKSVNKQGVCPETEWPYDDTPPAEEGGAFPPGAPDGEKPPAKAYADAAAHTVTSYHRVEHTLTQMRGCLHEGYPFVLGIVVFDSFWSGPGQQAKITPLPGPEDKVVGGHAVLAVGYDDVKQWLIVRNSWGPNAADHGYFYLPYAYAMEPHLASDFWTLRTVKA